MVMVMAVSEECGMAIGDGDGKYRSRISCQFLKHHALEVRKAVVFCILDLYKRLGEEPIAALFDRVAGSREAKLLEVFISKKGLAQPISLRRQKHPIHNYCIIELTRYDTSSYDDETDGDGDGDGGHNVRR